LVGVLTVREDANRFILEPDSRRPAAGQTANRSKLADADLITVTQDGDSIELGRVDGYGQVIDQAARIDGIASPAASD